MINDQLTLLTVSKDEKQRIARLAQQRGYETPEEYLRALINADAQAHGDALLFDDEDSDEYIRESIKQGLREAFWGNDFLTEEEFWKEVGDGE